MPETVRQLLDETSIKLAAEGFGQPRHEAAMLVSGLLGISLSDLYAHGERIIKSCDAASIREGTDRRIRHVPLSSIIGHVEFYGLTFMTGPGVLTPRPDSECLVEAGLSALAGLHGLCAGSGLAPGSAEPVRILDLCAGTGCIGISLASQLLKKSFSVDLTLTEIDTVAAAFAHRNLTLHGFSPACLVQCDLFPERPERGMGYHLIAANPPYIPSADIPGLMPEVRDHEPRLAIDGGPDGLDMIRRIISGAPAYLEPGGWLLLEHGFDQAEAVRGLLERSGQYRLIPSIRDYSGHFRVSGGCLYSVNAPLFMQPAPDSTRIKERGSGDARTL